MRLRSRGPIPEWRSPVDPQDHGTYAYYIHVCRLRPEGACKKCKTAKRRYDTTLRREHGIEARSRRFLSTCWCEATEVEVTPEDVWHGRTYTCGMPGCREAA